MSNKIRTAGYQTIGNDYVYNDSKGNVKVMIVKIDICICVYNDFLRRIS